MFERFTEPARRVIFFARYEASQLGSRSIEPEHLLLGLLREDERLLSRFWPQSEVQNLLDELKVRARVSREKVPTGVELPLGDTAKRALVCACEEADKLDDRAIHAMHILLGLLRVEGTLAWELLKERGLQLPTARDELSAGSAGQSGETSKPRVPDPTTLEWVVDLLRQQAAAQHRETRERVPLVPDAETAIRIAEAVWAPVYGQKRVEEQRPLQVGLVGNTWTVSGKAGDAENEPLIAMISRWTGEVFQIGP